MSELSGRRPDLGLGIENENPSSEAMKWVGSRWAVDLVVLFTNTCRSIAHPKLFQVQTKIELRHSIVFPLDFQHPQRPYPLFIWHVLNSCSSHRPESWCWLGWWGWWGWLCRLEFHGKQIKLPSQQVVVQEMRERMREDEGAELLGCHGANQFHFRLRLRSWEVRHSPSGPLLMIGVAHSRQSQWFPCPNHFSRVFCLSFHFGIEQPVNIKNIGTQRKKNIKSGQIDY